VALLYRNRPGEVSGLVYVAASAEGYVVGEELERDYFEDGEKELAGLGDVDDVFDYLGDVGVAFDGDRDDQAGACGDFLDVVQGLFVLEDEAGIVGILCGDADDGEGFVY
jgi:hypothetical protein